MGAAGRAVPAVPGFPLSHWGWKRSSKSSGTDCCEGPCSYLSSWTDAMESDEGGQKPPQNKFWKNSGETIPVVGTATSWMERCYPFISAMVLSCFINNRLVLENDERGTSTVITHCSSCEDCLEHSCVLTTSKDKQRNKSLTPCPPLQLDTVPERHESLKSEKVTHRNVIQ